MAPKKNRRKACWNCDSEIDLDIMICPYCASDLSSSGGKRHEPFAAQAMDRVPQPLYKPVRASENTRSINISEAVEENLQVGSSDSIKSFLFTLLYFLLGSVAFLFSLALLFLSDGEVLVLRWQSALWPAFFILALPLLVLGWRSWKQLDLS